MNAAVETNEQVLNQYGLNWNVEKRRLAFQDNEGVYHNTEDFGLVRSDNNFNLGVCKKDYHPFQNTMVLQTLRDFSDQYGFQIEKGGMFREGRRIYFQIRIADNVKVGRDSVEQYIFAANSFDKTVQLSFGYTNTVISCQNTFNRVMKNDVSYRFKHTTGSEKKVLEIPMLFEQHFNFRKQVNETYQNWADIKIPSGMVEDMLMHLLKEEHIATPEDMKLISTRKVNILTSLRSDIESEIKAKGDTIWGLFNGVTFNANHTRVVKNRENSRNESILIGNGNKMMNEAYDYLLANV